MGVKFCSTTCRRYEAAARASDLRGVCPRCRKRKADPDPSKEFCSEACFLEWGYANNKYSQEGDVNEAAVAALQPKRTAALTRFVDDGWAAALDRGGTSVTEVAELAQMTKFQVSKLYEAYKAEQGDRRRAAAFRPSDEALALLDDFTSFRQACFKVPDVHGHVLQGVAYQTPAFQARWGQAIDDVIANPGILVILAPPRHGKSEFLAHKLIQLIVQRPNIRAMWVGGNEDIANASVEQVRDELANNTEIARRYLPPGASFQPRTRQAGATWKTGKFTVNTRDTTGIKSATLLAVGKGGKILSRDADLIVVDDIVDHASSLTEGRRKDDWAWFRTQLMSRREPHTAVVVIGSRQHFADIYSHLITDDAVTSIVETAHDEVACQGSLHTTHEGCLLFPQLRSYDWLLSQEHALGRELYEMVYLNRPRSEGAALFSEQALRASRNYSRLLGTSGVPPDIPRIAGLDPATKGYQAAFAWAYDPASERQWMIDLDNTKGAGIEGSLILMKQWLSSYGIREWVIEDNAAQHAYLQEREIREWASAHGVTIRGHTTTHANKLDHNLGVTGMARMFSRGLIDLPYGDPATKAKTDLFINQCLGWESAQLHKALADVVMAAWFPQPTMRRARSQHLALAASLPDPDFPWAEMAFPDPYAAAGVQTTPSYAGVR